MAKHLFVVALAAACALCTSSAALSVRDVNSHDAKAKKSQQLFSKHTKKNEGHPNHLIFEMGQEVVIPTADEGGQPTGYWTDLFVPPYADCPTVITSISCLNQTRCFVSAGRDGAGFGVNEFDGSLGGEFKPMDMSDGPMMVMTVAVGSGKDGIPRGVSGGMGFGNSLQYLTTSQSDKKQMTWLPANLTADAPPFFPTQSIRASPDGQKILAVVEASMDPLPILLFSNTGGRNFTTHRITNPNRIVKTSGLRYAAMPSENTWFVTAGTWPRDDPKSSSTEKRADENKNIVTLSETLSIVHNKKTGEVAYKTRDYSEIRHARQSLPPSMKSEGGKKKVVSQQDDYASQIFRTVDGGKTFTSVFENIGDFCLNGIDCYDENTCYTVGSGVNGGIILGTRDGGKTWKTVYELPATIDQHLTLFTIAVSQYDGSIVAGGGWRGSAGFESFIISSTDGSNWARQKGLPGIREISSISLLPDGYGYATAITVMRATTVLALRPNGSPTLPPQSTFSQVSCIDEKCAELCMSVAFPQNKCLAVSGGGSTVVHCDLDRQELIQLYYPQSRVCDGNVTERSMPLNVCLKATSGGYFENVCKI